MRNKKCRYEPLSLPSFLLLPDIMTTFFSRHPLRYVTSSVELVHHCPHKFNPSPKFEFSPCGCTCTPCTPWYAYVVSVVPRIRPLSYTWVTTERHVGWVQETIVRVQPRWPLRDGERRVLSRPLALPQQSVESRTSQALDSRRDE